MSNEKQTGNTDWKTRLDELSVLPGKPSFDSSLSWEKLELRLQGKNKTSKTILYWFAAALVLAFTIIFAVKLLDDNDGIILNRTAKSNNTVHKKANIISIPVKEEQVIAVNHRDIMPDKKNWFKNSYKTALKNDQARIAKIDSMHDEAFVEKEDSIKTKDIVVQITKASPVLFPTLKKKIPVVHINELEKPVNPIEAVAGNEHRAFQQKLFNRQPFPDNDSPAGHDGNILRIRLSPQN